MSEYAYKKKTVFENGYDQKSGDAFAAKYLDFLSCATTERRAVDYFVKAAAQNGFAPFEEGKTYQPGDRVYFINRDKAAAFCVIGNKPMRDGIHIVAAHIDSPRLDLKCNPITEQDGIALFKTHYYGGIKKYQWTALPLAMEGIIVKKDGSKIDVHDDSLTFCISDLLPHLAQEQMQKTLSAGIEGENLRVLAATTPDTNEKTDAVKSFLLDLMHQKYGIEERDLWCAELSMVPKLAPAEIGLDKSMIGAYGQDDRVCAFTAFEGLLDIGTPKRTAVVFLADKEEVGSMGSTGMQGHFFERMIRLLSGGQQIDDIFAASRCLSADVNAAFDPLYPSVHDKQNACFLGCGPCFTKYTGAGGKSNTNDASAEVMRYFTEKMDEENICCQTGELGKVDGGGGGTVAKFMSTRDIDTLDIGVGLLSMHAPFEISSKADVYETFRAMRAFLR